MQEQLTIQETLQCSLTAGIPLEFDLKDIEYLSYFFIYN